MYNVQYGKGLNTIIKYALFIDAPPKTGHSKHEENEERKLLEIKRKF